MRENVNAAAEKRAARVRMFIRKRRKTPGFRHGECQIITIYYFAKKKKYCK